MKGLKNKSISGKIYNDGKLSDRSNRPQAWYTEHGTEFYLKIGHFQENPKNG
jgi:hypothetical protein